MHRIQRFKGFKLNGEISRDLTKICYGVAAMIWNVQPERRLYAESIVDFKTELDTFLKIRIIQMQGTILDFAIKGRQRQNGLQRCIFRCG